MSDKRVRELEEDLARLELEYRALVELCLRKKLLTRAELVAVRNEIDAADGASDTRMTKVPRPRD